jgi:hypothetical protein
MGGTPVEALGSAAADGKLRHYKYTKAGWAGTDADDVDTTVAAEQAGGDPRRAARVSIGDVLRGRYSRRETSRGRGAGESGSARAGGSGSGSGSGSGAH